jgi:hypothetical protein
MQFSQRIRNLVAIATLGSCRTARLGRTVGRRAEGADRSIGRRSHTGSAGRAGSGGGLSRSADFGGGLARLATARTFGRLRFGAVKGRVGHVRIGRFDRSRSGRFAHFAIQLRLGCGARSFSTQMPGRTRRSMAFGDVANRWTRTTRHVQSDQIHVQRQTEQSDYEGEPEEVLPIGQGRVRLGAGPARQRSEQRVESGDGDLCGDDRTQGRRLGEFDCGRRVDCRLFGLCGFQFGRTHLAPIGHFDIQTSRKRRVASRFAVDCSTWIIASTRLTSFRCLFSVTQIKGRT